jgi:hypothetical protein
VTRDGQWTDGSKVAPTLDSWIRSDDPAPRELVGEVARGSAEWQAGDTERPLDGCKQSGYGRERASMRVVRTPSSSQ